MNAYFLRQIIENQQLTGKGQFSIFKFLDFVLTQDFEKTETNY